MNVFDISSNIVKNNLEDIFIYDEKDITDELIKIESFNTKVVDTIAFENSPIFFKYEDYRLKIYQKLNYNVK